MKGPFHKTLRLTVQSKPDNPTHALSKNPDNPIKLHPIQATQRIQAYVDKGMLREARNLFDETPERDMVMWTAMIAGHTTHSQHEHAWATFRDMIRAGQLPNEFSFSSLLKACKGMGCGLRGSVAHGLAVKHGLDGYLYVGNGLLDMYASCRETMGDACMLFDGMVVRTGAMWTSMIAGHTKQGDGLTGIRTFQRMIQDGVELSPFCCSVGVRACASLGSLILGQQIHATICKYGFEFDVPVANSLLDFYCRCMCLSEAKQYFKNMHNRDLISWNTLIACFERIGSFESLQLFSQMSKQDLDPNCFTFTTVASACAQLAVLNCGQQVHGAIIQKGFNGSLVLANALLDMYAKCGSIAYSQRIFKEIQQKDLRSWTSMLIGYGTHGLGRKAMELFDKMIGSGIQLDCVVFMCILSACSHAGLVDEGLKYFSSMVVDHHIFPDQEICGCVVDMLGRAGRIMEAYDFIKGMPFEADESVWGTLLGACKVHKNVDVGKLAAEKVLGLKPKAAKTYVVLANIYAADGRWDEFAVTRNSMRRMGCQKEVGRSWIEVGNEVFSFIIGDRSSPDLELVHAELEMLNQNMQVVWEANSDVFSE